MLPRIVIFLSYWLFSHASLYAENNHPKLNISHKSSNPTEIQVKWNSDKDSYVLQHSYNLNEWHYISQKDYEIVNNSYTIGEISDSNANFYKLKEVGIRQIYVIGDSISTRYNWPRNLANLTGIKTFTQAIGGTKSPSMVSRTQGVELAYPISDAPPISRGTIPVKWHRHIADRTQTESYRSKWPEYVKTVSEPTSIEVYSNNKFVVLAKRELKNINTVYELHQKTIFCNNHGLNNGDRVTFISEDLGWPASLSVLDSSSTWNFNSSLLPSNVIERRVYFVSNSNSTSFEIKEFEGDTESLDLGSDADPNSKIECGWFANVEYDGGEWDLTWKVRTEHDDSIWLLEVSANDIPKHSSTYVTIPNTETLLAQLLEINPRFLLICPPSGSFPNRGPESFNWDNYYESYIPWVKTTYPNNHIDTMALLGANRTATEKSFLEDPETPKLLWIKGDPLNESSWTASDEEIAEGFQQWIGPGYLPLQYRARFSDGIHINSSGNQALAEAIAQFIEDLGW